MIPAEYFDILGLVGFLALLIFGIKLRKRKKKIAWAIIIISVLGLVIDGYVVVTHFILR